jgi:tetratricopeptide (TPR) repeat protein
MRPTPLPVAAAEARNTLGLALAGQARLQEARLCFEEALRLRPDFCDAHHNLGCICRQLGYLPEAEASFRQVLRLRPDLAPAHYNLGLALAEQGRLTEAVAEYYAALHLRPDLADAHNNLGSLSLQMGRLAEAESSFREALQLRPRYAEAWYNLGLTLLKQQRPADSLAAFQEALWLRPEFPEAHNKHGEALYAVGRFPDALASYRRAIDLKSDFADALCNFATTLCRLGRFAEAAPGLRQILPDHPQHAGMHAVLAYALAELGQLQQAADHFRLAIRSNPDFADPHYNLSLLWLLQGDFELGFAEYEWRLQIKELGIQAVPSPRWDGRRLDGKTILLVAEQGLGDTLQFIRYAPLVKERGGRVLVWSFSPLTSLLRTCPGVDGVVPEEERPPDTDLHAHLVSLPYLLGTTLATIPASLPYLSADPMRVAHWRKELSTVPDFKIGIVWQGSPENKKDSKRSVLLREFAPLARVDGVRLFSLQVGQGSEQLVRGNDFTVTDLGSHFDASSFADAAAVIMNLDLVVSVDTAVAHLAGALGAPVWAALPANPDWRWLLERADSPWYPRMRLFRQSQPGNWRLVFERMAMDLQRLCNSVLSPSAMPR